MRRRPHPLPRRKGLVVKYMLLIYDNPDTRELFFGPQALLGQSLHRGQIGAYQLQAAIAAVHMDAPRAEATHWAQILALYGLLERLQPSPVVTLNRAVAVAMVNGPAPALEVLDQLGNDDRIGGHHRFHAVRAHVLELAGDLEGARASYELAAQLTTSLAERRYVRAKAHLADRPSPEGANVSRPDRGRGGSGHSAGHPRVTRRLAPHRQAVSVCAPDGSG